MIAFIIVITMISGYFVGLESRTIDNDAIAYRTGVILVEDPGYTANRQTSWELNDIDHTFNVLRFGLAYSDDPLGASRNYPNILSLSKIQKFFDSTYFPTSEDYQSRLIFGDRAYSYDISLHSIDNVYDYHTPNPPADPQGYGYIRRVVKIREPQPVIIDAPDYASANPGGIFMIPMDFSALYSYSAPYLIDPLQDPVTIEINNLGLLNPLPPPPLPYLQEVSLLEGAVPIQSLNEFVTIDGDPLKHPPYSVTSDVDLTLQPGFFKTYASKSSRFTIKYTFRSDPGDGNGMTGSATNFIPGFETTDWPWPKFVPAVLEVKIW